MITFENRPTPHLGENFIGIAYKEIPVSAPMVKRGWWRCFLELLTDVIRSFGDGYLSELASH